MTTFAALRSTARADPRRNARVAAAATTRTAGPQDDAPSYSDIDNAPWNKQITALFRQRMIAKIGEDTEEQGYDGIIALTRKLNSMYKGSCADPKQTQEATVEILLTLFPSWLPQFFSVLFAKPFPEFSNKMNAWVTALTCQWLMGPNQVVDYERPDGSVAVAQAVQVERQQLTAQEGTVAGHARHNETGAFILSESAMSARCRYLEETGCAAVCMNSCKVPTQEFFRRHMGMDVALEPNYDDFSCKFVFGQKPLPQDQDEVFTTPCFQQCPSKKRAGVLTEQCGGVEAQVDARVAVAASSETA